MLFIVTSMLSALQMPNGWDDVRVTIGRPNSPDPDGPCGNTRPEDDYPGATLSARKY